MAGFQYQDPFPLQKKDRPYRLLSSDLVTTVQQGDRTVVQVAPEGLTLLAREAFRDVSFLLRSRHLEQVAAILDDPEASDNDKEVAATLLRNADIAARFELPSCQDTGTAIVIGKKGEDIRTGCNDAEELSRGIFRTYTEENLRYSQTVPLNMYEEKNSGTNLPAQIDLYATQGGKYEFVFVAKGGGSANKTFLYQETKALLNPERLTSFLVEKMKSLGTAACPPYHIGIVIGGTSAETCLKTVKMASIGELDGLPDHGNDLGQAFRDKALEAELLEAARNIGFGAQFGGVAFAHDIRVVRLPRHGASCPVGIGVSCSADRNITGRIDKDGIWLEELEREPARFLPDAWKTSSNEGVVPIDLNQPMEAIVAELTRHPIKTRVALTGTIIVARDIAHAKFKERLDAGEGLPDYLLHHPVYYAGPAKTPEGKASGSFGPTTAGRMDPYVDLLQGQKASLVMIAKGNRSQAVTDSCQKHGGFYLGSIGGAAAILADQSIKKVTCLDYQELGMEAVWKIEVEDFPAFILVDDKGNDFFRQ